MYVRLFHSRGSPETTEHYDGHLIASGPAMDLERFLVNHGQAHPQRQEEMTRHGMSGQTQQST